MATPKKKVKFLVDTQVEAQGEIVFSAKAGEVVELSASSANRWLRRNVATTDIMASVKVEESEELAEAKQDAPITSNEEESEKEETPKAKPASTRKAAPRKKA